MLLRVLGGLSGTERGNTVMSGGDVELWSDKEESRGNPKFTTLSLAEPADSSERTGDVGNAGPNLSISSE